VSRVRRDLLYLASVVANAALMVWFGDALLLASLGPAWLLRRGSLRPVWTTPLALIALEVSAAAAVCACVIRAGHAVLSR
jgi:hypothetical protein